MISKFVSKIIDKCLTEYKHPLFDSLVNECSGFYLTPLDSTSVKGYPMFFEPKCYPMKCCWGILNNSDEVIKLWYIVDSSD